MQKLIFINLKNNFTITQTKRFLTELEQIIPLRNNQLIICLNHLSLFLSSEFIKLNFAVQSFFNTELGAFTSCNPLVQIIEFNHVNYCLLGHCEEIKNFSLSLADINQKVMAASQTNLNLLICFGENQFLDKLQRKQELLQQISVLLENVNSFKNIILAYEPKYAVNTDMKIDPIEINELFVDLKITLKNKYGHNFQICFGGNVNENNIQDFYRQDNIDGLLIGRYGLKITNLKYIFKNIIA